jgi:hypothetical protein
MNWKPVETAPNGEWVLCYAKGWKYPCVLIKEDKEWFDESGDHDQEWRPTHWMRWPVLD